MVLRASWLRNGNVPGGQNVFAVMNVMGHTTMSTPMKYQHQAIDEVAEVAAIQGPVRAQKGHNRWNRGVEPKLTSD
jgi:hypothetical protein